MQQLQLDLPSEETIALGATVREQLIQLMAEMMLAVIGRERETSDDGQSS